MKRFLPPLALFLLCLPAAAQDYTIQDLGLLPGGTYSEAAAINNLGHVTGTADASVNISFNKNSDEHGAEAFFWHAGKFKT